jgi:hypothetical protein
MADEVQNTGVSSTEGLAQESKAESKIKKVNRLTLSALNDKIKELEDINQKNSRYYKHLLIRQKEFEKA